jgi:hypothetical protein
MTTMGLRRGAVVSVFSAMAGLVVVFLYDTAAYTRDAEEGIGVILTEMALFLVIAFAGLVAATYVSVMGVDTHPIRRCVVAIVLNWTALFIPAALVLSPFVGGFGRIADIVVITVPYFLLGQVIAAAVALIVNRRSARRRGA